MENRPDSTPVGSGISDVVLVVVVMAFVECTWCYRCMESVNGGLDVICCVEACKSHRMHSI
jgi:hypothetical protein